MRWRGSIYRFAFCTCDFLCTTLVPSSQTQTVWRRATCDLIPSRTPLVPRAPSSLSALQIAISMGAFPALTRTRFHLCYRRCIVNCVLRAEIQRSSPAPVSRFCPREQLARDYCLRWCFFPSTFLLFELAYIFFPWALRHFEHALPNFRSSHFRLSAINMAF